MTGLEVNFSGLVKYIHIQKQLSELEYLTSPAQQLKLSIVVCHIFYLSQFFLASLSLKGNLLFNQILGQKKEEAHDAIFWDLAWHP